MEAVDLGGVHPGPGHTAPEAGAGAGAGAGWILLDRVRIEARTTSDGAEEGDFLLDEEHTEFTLLADDPGTPRGIALQRDKYRDR